jgi:hypothetical protein
MHGTPSQKRTDCVIELHGSDIGRPLKLEKKKMQAKSKSIC